MKRKTGALLLILLIAIAAGSFLVLREGKEKGIIPRLSGDRQLDETYITNKDAPAVPEAEVTDGRLSLYYDDRYSFDSDIAGIYSETEEPVLTADEKDPRRVIATECGEAEVSLENGEVISVSVGPAPISLILIAGQSNGEGRISENRTVDTVRDQYVLNREGTAYSTYGISDKAISEEVTWFSETTDDLSISNFEDFLPASLTDNSENSRFAQTNSITDAAGAAGKGGIDSAFAYRWHELTGEKIWLVNACHHGTSIESWQPGDSETDNDFWQAVELYRGAEKILSDEIAAGHYTLSHKGVLWYQGEGDRYMEDEQYYGLFMNTYNGLIAELDGEDIEGTEGRPEFMALFMPRSMLSEDEARDMYLTEPRTVQYYVATSEGPDDIFLASHIEELWHDNASVKKYFENRYGNGFSGAYPVRADELRMPEVTGDVHGDYHFTQLGYNEIGFDGAESVCSYLGYYEEDPDRQGPVSVVFSDGLTDVSGSTVSLSKGVTTRFAVKAYPATREKDIEVETSDNIEAGPYGIKLKNDEAGTIRVRAGKYETEVKVVPKQKDHHE